MRIGASPVPPYILRRSTRSRRLRITIDPELGLVVTVPVATRRGWAHPERLIDEFLRDLHESVAEVGNARTDDRGTEYATLE